MQTWMNSQPAPQGLPFLCPLALLWRLRFGSRARCDVAATLADRLEEGAERRGLDWRVERAEREVRLVAWSDG